MENQEIINCLRMTQNSINYNVIEYIQQLQDNKVDQNCQSQMCFIETFKKQIIKDIYSITDLMITKLQHPGRANKNKLNDNCLLGELQNDEQDYTQSKPQEQPQTQVILIRDKNDQDEQEEEDGGENGQIQQKMKIRKEIIFKKEMIQNTIYQQFLNSYDPIKRNKSQIIYYLSEQTGWSVSTIQNIIRKCELKKINPIIYKNKTKVMEFMQKSYFQSYLGKMKQPQNFEISKLNEQMEEQTSNILDYRIDNQEQEKQINQTKEQNVNFIQNIQLNLNGQKIKKIKQEYIEKPLKTQQ